MNLFSIYVLIQRLLNYYPNYSTRRLYFGEVETPYNIDDAIKYYHSKKTYGNSLTSPAETTGFPNKHQKMIIFYHVVNVFQMYIFDGYCDGLL